MPRVQRLTLKQVQMLTPEQINKMTESEVARALTTVQDVIKKRQKRAAESGVELPGLENYKPKSTRELSRNQMVKQLRYAQQAVENKTASITGVKQSNKETWERIKQYAQEDNLLSAEKEVIIQHQKRPSPEVWRTMTKEEKEAFNYQNKKWRLPKDENPLDNPRFRKNFWKVYDEIKNSSQGFGTENSWTSNILQGYIMRKFETEKYSDADIVNMGQAISDRMYKIQQQIEETEEKEMEPWGYNDNNDYIDVNGDEDLFDF